MAPLASYWLPVAGGLGWVLGEQGRSFLNLRVLAFGRFLRDRAHVFRLLSAGMFLDMLASRGLPRLCFFRVCLLGAGGPLWGILAQI